MILLDKIDFLEEIKAEMAGYEEIEKEHVDKWIDSFEKYIHRKSVNDKRVINKGGKFSIKLDDESDFFKIVDKFLAAIMNEDLDAYWSNWSL